jgi:ADP-ribosylglycohydrolase
MAALTLTLDTYRDRVFGGWQGKSAGVTFGAPQRGQLVPGRGNYYNPVPGQPAASVVLDFSLVWLQALETTGPEIAPEDLAVAWLEHLDYSQDEFGYAALNLRRGLPPPASGAHSNWFKHGTGGVMRADFWALIAPGAPQVAAAYAYHDAKIDHSEDGLWAAMFLAAIGSAAFFLADPLVLLTIGLAMIPRTCRTARAVKTAIACGQRAASWLEAREAVQNEVGSKDFTDVPQNMGFFAIGLLYGRDFGSALCAAVNCGYDSETVGGAIGAVLGIRFGGTGLPEPWTRPIGDLVIPGNDLRDFEAPSTISEVTERLVALGRRVVAARCPDVALVEGLTATSDLSSRAAFLEFRQDAAALEPFAVPPALGADDLPTPAATPPNPADAAPAAISASGLLDPASTAPTPPLPLPDPAAYHGPDDSLLSAGDVPASEPAVAIQAPDGITRQPTTPSSPPSPLAAMPGVFTPQPVGEAAPLADVPTPGMSQLEPALPAPAPQPDPTSAIAWADNTQVKALLITPPNALVGQAGAFAVVMDTQDSPTLAYNQPKTLSFTISNTGATAFSGRVTLLAPPGWQISAPANLGQRQYIAAQTGILRIDFTIRAIENQARIDIANAITLRLTPEGGAPVQAEFVLLGASCWWVVGPFANFDGEGFDRSYLPEDRPGLNETYFDRSGQKARWEKRTYPESVLDLEPVFRGSSGVCYGQTVLRSPTAREARIVANTNSGVKVWLNGALVFRRFNRETFRPTLGAGTWATDVILNAGDNPVMVKWVRSSEPFAFSLTVSDRYGRGLPEIGNTTW